MNVENNNNQLRIGVIGIGPVGAIISAHLAKANAFVVTCDVIYKKIKNIKKSGIILQNKIEMHSNVNEVCDSISELDKFDLDLIIIAVKAPFLNIVIDNLKKLDSKNTFYMVAQNGIDNEIEVADAFGKDKTLRMVINFAGNMSDMNTVQVNFFNPPNYLAPLSQEGNDIAARIVELFNSTKLDTIQPDNILNYVWEKAILNASLSAVCAISHKTMKEVMDFPMTEELVRGIVDESILVAEKENIVLKEDFSNFCIEYLKKTGHHKPSMLVDIENGLITEIDNLNGKIAEYGRKHNIPTPYNQTVTAFVSLLEHYTEKN